MQLDLRSVEKVPFSTFTWVFARKMLGIGLPRLRMTWSFLQDLSRAVSRFPRGPVAGYHRQHCFDPTGSNTITIVHRIEKKSFFRSNREMNVKSYLTQFGSKNSWLWYPATGPLEKRETALDRSWRKLRLILRRGRPISNISGQKLIRTYRKKGVFSTDWKSKCIRIGLRAPRSVGRRCSARVHEGKRAEVFSR